MRLYIGNKNYSSWSLRPWLVLTELGIPFEEVLLPFGDETAWAPFRELAPNAKVPCLVHGAFTGRAGGPALDDPPQFVVWESLGIVEYLAEQFPAVWPEDRRARAWARSASAEMHAGFAVLRERCSMSIGVRVRLHEHPESLRKDVARIGRLFGDGLARFGGPFLAGARFTAVDAFFAPVAFRVQTYGLDLPAEARGYVDRLLALPGMQSWYAAGIAETFRDEPHDADVAAAGTCLADLRASRP